MQQKNFHADDIHQISIYSNSNTEGIIIMETSWVDTKNFLFKYSIFVEMNSIYANQI